jgi:hypothetical protein
MNWLPYQTEFVSQREGIALCEQILDAGSVQSTQGDSGGIPFADDIGEVQIERLIRRQLDVPVGDDDENRRVEDLPGHEPEEFHAGLIGPVHVFEHQNNWPRLGKSRQPIPDLQIERTPDSGFARSLLTWQELGQKWRVRVVGDVLTGIGQFRTGNANRCIETICGSGHMFAGQQPA